MSQVGIMNFLSLNRSLTGQGGEIRQLRLPRMNPFPKLDARIVRADNHVFVATEGSTILAVGAVTSSGEITLNYVSPDARFAGVSKALLNRLEAKTLELGNNTCTLTSTETARRFYLSAGYKQQSSSKNLLATSSSYLMIKQLSPVHG